MARRRGPHRDEEFDDLDGPEDVEAADDDRHDAPDDDRDRSDDDDRDDDDRDDDDRDDDDRDDDDRDDDDRDDDDRDGDGDGQPGAGGRRSWGTRLILGFAALVVLASGTAITAAWLPRWWAEQVAAVVAGNTITGVLAGLVCGLVGTALPLFLLWSALRRRRRTGMRVTAVVCALLVAVPDLTTLGIQVGGGRAASDGARILDLHAPAFRGATLAGAVLGVLVTVGLIWSRVTRRRHRRQIRQLRAQVRSQGDRTPTAPGDTASGDQSAEVRSRGRRRDTE